MKNLPDTDSNLDQALMFEILSRLSSSTNVDNDSTEAPANNGNGRSPFFAQREAEQEGCMMHTAAAATDDCTKLFFMACPLLLSTTNTTPTSMSSLSENNNGSCVLPAIYSRDAICQEFIHVLQTQYYSGNLYRISSSDMCMWLGIDNESDINLVGDLVCDQQQQQRHWHGKVCKVYNPRKQQHEYAMVEHLKASLLDKINHHVAGLPTISSSNAAEVGSSSNEYIPSLEEILCNQRLRSNECLVPIATVTMKQLAKEMELSCEDVSWLLGDTLEFINDGSSKYVIATTSNSKSGDVMHDVYNSQVGNRTSLLEKQLLSALSGVTVPTMVSAYKSVRYISYCSTLMHVGCWSHALRCCCCMLFMTTFSSGACLEKLVTTKKILQEQ